MRVLHLTRDLPPRCTGGISTAVASFAAALGTAGVPTAVISFDHWRRRAPGAAIVEADASGAALRIRRGEPLAEMATVGRALRPSVIHLHHENLWPYAERLRRILDCPIVYGIHVLQHEHRAAPRSSVASGEEGGRHGATASASDQAVALRGADLIVAPSRFAAGAARRSAPRATAIHIVPNIVEAAATARSAAPTSEPVAVYAGRFDRAKGTDLLFEAMAVALRRDPALRFEIAGGLPASRKHERRWRRHWEAGVAAELRERVLFHGWLDAIALGRLWARARVHVVPSRCETFGLSAAEAMVHAVPVVATRAGALPEIVSDGETGLLAEAEDPAGLAERILLLTGDAPRAAAMGERAALAVGSRCSRDAVLPRLLAAYAAAVRA